jgi:hypothetical protein
MEERHESVRVASVPRCRFCIDERSNLRLSSDHREITSRLRFPYPQSRGITLCITCDLSPNGHRKSAGYVTVTAF